jgi:SAM-dependent methyltransferase
MNDRPNADANTEDFEFQALAGARNYRQALLAEFHGPLRGNLLEVGAGIGQVTDLLLRLPAVKQVVSIEPNPAFCKQHRTRLPGRNLIEGIVADVPADGDWDSVLSINVLEHIRDDTDELKGYSALLRKRRGALCLLVPARPELYAPIDKDFGHFRRYRRAELRQKLLSAGFTIERLHYFNSLGYFAWWLNFCLLRRRHFEPWKVVFHDRVIFPLVHTIESKIIRPPFGQSLLAVARAAL